MPIMHGYDHAVNQIHTTIYDLPMQNFHCLLALKVALCHNNTLYGTGMKNCIICVFKITCAMCNTAVIF